MKHRSENDWLDNLEAIVEGHAPPPGDDAELYHVATRLAAALAPLRSRASTEVKGRQRIPAVMRVRYYEASPKLAQRFALARLLVVALLLVVAIASFISTVGLPALRTSAGSAWRASTSFEQITGFSVASLSPQRAGVRPLPLLPVRLPANTQAAAYGVVTDASDPHVMTVFVADYRVGSQDVLLYEQPSAILLPSTSAQIVHIGNRQGQLFSDNEGNHALQWYQDDMMCQLTSKLPAAQLLQLASVFQPIKSWDLLR